MQVSGMEDRYQHIDVEKEAAGRVAMEQAVTQVCAFPAHTAPLSMK